MADQALRNAERAALDGDTAAQATLLRARMRAGTLSKARVVLSAYIGGEWGGEAAREVAPPQECTVCALSIVHDDSIDPVLEYEACVDSVGLKDWTAGLSPLLAALDPVRRSVACIRLLCSGRPIDCGGTDCGGTGTRQITVPAEQWWSVRAAVAVARAVHGLAHGWSKDEAKTPCPRCECPKCKEITHALEAAERWLDEPTDAHAVALGIACSAEIPDWCRFAGVRIAPDAALPRVLTSTATLGVKPREILHEVLVPKLLKAETE